MAAARNYRTDLTAEQARLLLRYEPETGRFFWRVKPSRSILAGAETGLPNTAGYSVIRIDRKPFLAHRIAWLITFGRWPSDDLDHRNLLRSDNRLSNLREATVSQNCQNMPIRSDNKSGFKGVSWDSINKKWVARIRVPKGSYRNLGRFNSAIEAHQAYCASAREMFGEFARVA